MVIAREGKLGFYIFHPVLAKSRIVYIIFNNLTKYARCNDPNSGETYYATTQLISWISPHITVNASAPSTEDKQGC
ncbi:hypothetical protein [Nostoc sp. MS1]|uniref:hypothetical protein n=1 Tax=Nostoc sp. MS1 TaxID=2764711 RepID=UPI001CC5E6BD|nr:hypothetical protein [Nostoc sp. MS1]